MRKIIGLVFIIFSLLVTTDALAAEVQPAMTVVPAAMVAPVAVMEAPMAAVPAVPAMVAPAAPMAAVAAPMAPAPLPAMAVVPVAAMTAPLAPMVPTMALVAPKVVQAATEYVCTESPLETIVTAAATEPATKLVAPAVPKAPFNWTLTIGIIGIILMSLLTILGSLGLLKFTQSDRWQTILKATKKGTEAFVQYAASTPASWDDAVAAILDNTNAVLLAGGYAAMTDAEKDKAAVLATTFKNVATFGKK
jgi:hypothetical protein